MLLLSVCYLFVSFLTTEHSAYCTKSTATEVYNVMHRISIFNKILLASKCLKRETVGYLDLWHSTNKHLIVNVALQKSFTIEFWSLSHTNAFLLMVSLEMFRVCKHMHIVRVSFESQDWACALAVCLASGCLQGVGRQNGNVLFSWGCFSLTTTHLLLLIIASFLFMVII